MLRFAGHTTFRLLLLSILISGRVCGQTSFSNSPVTVTANELRDRLYDTATSSALLRAPVYAAVLHLMEEATRKNPGVIGAQDAIEVMQNVVSRMTNELGSSPQMTMQDLTSVALPYLANQLSAKLAPAAVNAIQTGLSMTILAEQQGLFSAVYSNLTTALPSGSIFPNVASTASSLLALQRQAASQVASLALPELIRTASQSAFRDAAAQLASQITSITPDDALDTIVQAVPALRTNQLVLKLAQAADNVGQAATDVNTLVSAATGALDALHQSVAGDSGLLGQIATAQQDIIGSLTDPEILSDSLAMAQQISADISSSIDAAQQTVTFAGTLIGIAGNSQLAQQIATVGSAAIKVANTVGDISDAITAADGIFSSVGAIATGNFIGAALDVFSMFGGGSSGPSPDQVILNQIAAVQQNIAQMRADMDNRFDQVDAALTNIMQTLNSNFSMISNNFSSVLNNLSQIEGSLYDLQGQMQKLEGQIYTWLTAVDQESLYLLLHNSLGYEARVGGPMSYTNGGPEGDFVSFEGEYWLWAVQNAANGLYQPMLGSNQVSDLYKQLTTDTNAEDNVSYINGFIRNNNNLGLPQPFNGSLANPRVWSIAANGLSEMCVENPTYFQQFDINGDLQSVIQAGNNLSMFLNNLVALGTNAPNTELWMAVCNAYRNAVPDFTNAILDSLAIFNSSNGFTIANGYPASFNPLTNEFLSLVTPRSTVMTSGNYAVASVVSVSAMACSPTPNGMPIYFLDQNTLRSLDTNGMITTWAGRTNAGFQDGSSALFNGPQGLAVGLDGSVYVADTGNHAIRVYNTSSGLTTLAGYLAGTNDTVPLPGAADGIKGAARFNSPRGLAIDSAGNLLVADTSNHAVREVTPEGVVTTLAGTLGLGGVRNGLTVEAAHGNSALVAQFWRPEGLAMDTNGLIYVTDPISRSIRTIEANGTVGTYRAQGGSLAFLLPQALAAASPPAADQSFGNFVVVAAGGSVNSLALTAGGTVVAWGDNSTGACDVPAGLTNIVAVAAGNDCSLALKADGTVVALGSNGDGYTQANVPAGLSNVVAILAQNDFSLALKADGAVVAWGDNGHGQCSVPAGLTNVVALATGVDSPRALKVDGTVAAWGDNLFGQCNVPAGLSNVVAAPGGYDFSLALKADGTVAAWGYNLYGQCSVPAGLSNVVAVAAGDEHSLALRADGTLAAWGANYDGQCNVPAGLSNVVAVGAGGGFCLALKADGTVAAWGDDTDGKCDVPVGLSNVVAVGVAWVDDFSVALKADGTVAAWGRNTYGECTVPSLAGPQQSSDTLVAQAAVQQFTAGVITPDGRLLVADNFGLRLFDYSDRIQKQAASWLLNDINSGRSLTSAGQELAAWHMLLQNLATYGLSSALATNDALHALLFGSAPLMDSAGASSFLSGLISTPDWRPTHSDLGTTALQQIDQLQYLLLGAVQQAAQNPNPANLPLVTDTLSRLNLLLATHSQPIPAPALSLAPGTNQTAQVVLNGYPYMRYNLRSSADLKSWTTNSAVLRDAGGANVSTVATPARFFGAVQAQ